MNANAVLFTAKEDDDIRAIDQSIELMGIVRDTDVDLLGGRCCEEISLLSEDAEVKNFPGPMGLQPVAVYCFSINNVNNIWTFCDEEKNAIALFRNSIKEIIVSKFSVQQGQVAPVFITDAAELRTASSSFSWATQDEWVNTCKTGKYQSPIEFEEEEAQETLKSLDFEYEEFVPVTVNYQRNEAEAVGEFGAMYFADAEGTKVKYNAYKIVFKFPAEHIIND